MPTRSTGNEGDATYHISQDKRSQKSAELVYQGLLDCLREKPFDHISVTDLQKASGVARTTFYRSFDNMSDVLYWKCDTCFHEVLGEYRPQEFKGELDLARHYFAYWMQHSDILELLIKINRQDIIYACHTTNADILQQRFGSLPGLSVRHADYFMSIRTGFTISILTTWLKGGRKEGLDEIMQIIREQIFILAESGS